MLHSPDPARPFQVANTHSWVVSENSDKAIEGDPTPLIRDRVIWLQTIFQKSVAALPVVTYQAGETVICRGFKDRSAAHPREGRSRNPKGGYRNCSGGGAWRRVWRALRLTG